MKNLLFHEKFGKFIFNTFHCEEVMKKSNFLAVFKWTMIFGLAVLVILILLILRILGGVISLPILFWFCIIFMLLYPIFAGHNLWRRAYYDMTIFEQGFVLRHRKRKSDLSYDIAFSDIKTIKLTMNVLQIIFFDKHKQPIKKYINKCMIQIPSMEMKNVKAISLELIRAYNNSGVNEQREEKKKTER